MKHRVALLSLFMALIMVFTLGCSEKSDGSSVISDVSSKVSPEHSASFISSEVTPSSEVVTPSEEIPGNKYVSPTTGKTYTTEQEFYPIMVTIENASGARPQTGIASADIVYEFPVESTITRFLCIYNDTLPKVVGPVRSCRYYFLYCQREWDSIYMSFGGVQGTSAASVYLPKYNWTKVWIDGLLGKYNRFYWRSTDRSAPHNVYSDLSYVKEKYPDYVSKRTEFWKFSDSPSSSSISATSIHIPFASDKKHNVEFFFNKDTCLYTRYENGQPFLSKETDDSGKVNEVPVTVTNIIVQYLNMSTEHIGNYFRRFMNVIGSGKAEFFIDGKYIKGKWVRSSETSTTKYYDDVGKEIVFSKGSTWIAIQPNPRIVTFE